MPIGTKQEQSKQELESNHSAEGSTNNILDIVMC